MTFIQAWYLRCIAEAMGFVDARVVWVNKYGWWVKNIN
jgi:hypothetical protein